MLWTTPGRYSVRRQTDKQTHHSPRSPTDALLALSASLSLAPPSTTNLPTLFYIAGLCLQWLKSEANSGSVLRSGELQLLKVDPHTHTHTHTPPSTAHHCLTDPVQDKSEDILPPHARKHAGECNFACPSNLCMAHIIPITHQEECSREIILQLKFDLEGQVC